jgi:soluble lytic murein transglycosylase-like protein
LKQADSERLTADTRMIGSPQLRRSILTLALCACAGSWAAPAVAQSRGEVGARPAGRIEVPRVSTKLSDAEVDLTPEKAPAPAVAGPGAAGMLAAVEDHSGHMCLTGDAGVDQIVREAGTRYGVDPCLVVAVMGVESGFRRDAVSPKGACGYMQLMPDTARRFGVVDIFDPRQNITAATQYLRVLLERFSGNLDLTLAGYNAGENAVTRYGFNIPPYLETQNYVRSIADRYLNRHPWLTKPASRASAAPSAASSNPPVNPRMVVEFAKPVE